MRVWLDLMLLFLRGPCTGTPPLVPPWEVPVGCPAAGASGAARTASNTFFVAEEKELVRLAAPPCRAREERKNWRYQGHIIAIKLPWRMALPGRVHVRVEVRIGEHVGGMRCRPCRR